MYIASQSTCLLLSSGVELHNQLLIEVRVDVPALRLLRDPGGEVWRIPIQPARSGPGFRDLRKLLEVGPLPRSIPDLNHVARLDEHRWNVGASSINREVPVCDEHPRLRPALGEIESVNNIVQPALKQYEQSLAREAALLLSRSIVAPELSLRHVIHATSFLFLSQLFPVFGNPASAPKRLSAMVPWRIGTALEGAFRGVATLPLQEELFAFPSA